MVYVWLSVYGIVAPLAVTNFAGGRLLLAPYILVVIFALHLIAEILYRFPLRKMVLASTCAVFLLLIIHYAQIYSSIGVTNRTRLEAMSDAVEQSTGVVYLEEYEYPEYMWGQDIASDHTDRKPKWLRDYKIFYGIPEEYEVYLID